MQGTIRPVVCNRVGAGLFVRRKRARISHLVGHLVPVPYRFMTLVGLAGVRCTHHIDVGHVGIVGLDIALQLVDKCAMRLFWVGERLGSACLRHIANYADVSAITQPPLGYQAGVSVLEYTVKLRMSVTTPPANCAEPA